MTVNISSRDLEIWADCLLNHSVGGVTPDDVVMLKGERIAWPLLSVLQDKVFAAGAVADVCLVPPDNDRGRVWGASVARHGSIAQIERAPSWHRARYETMTKYIEVLGAEAPEMFAGLPQEMATALARADEPYRSIRLLKPWVITLYPTRGYADLEEMNLDEYASVIVAASTVDPRLLEAAEEPICKVMDASRTVRIVTEHPRSGKTLELTMSIGDHKVRKCTGKHNVPDGEVFTSPDARTTEGEIFVDMPVSESGVTVQGIHLRFEAGVIREYSAERGGDALARVVETDAGSRRLGEVAFGMNAGITRALRHPLFAEKVGGTVHIAIGASYPECYVDDPASAEGKARCDELARQGSLNRSAQHVDIVTDFRGSGTGRAVYLDDTKLAVKDGIWVVP